MNVLAIGNSFSQDATRHLHAIAQADGENLQITNLYIGGCSLERHYRNMLSGESAYVLERNGDSTGSFVSLGEALKSDSWDIVTLQQVSILSFNKESYEPYISALADFVRKYAPKAKLYLHQTWAYEDGSDKLLSVARYDSAEKMLRDVVRVNSEVAANICADFIIPSGELFGKLLCEGVTGIHRDTLHASLGVGRYALGLLWYRAVFGKSVKDNTFRDFDEPISEKNIEIIKGCVDTFIISDKS